MAFLGYDDIDQTMIPPLRGAPQREERSRYTIICAEAHYKWTGEKRGSLSKEVVHFNALHDDVPHGTAFAYVRNQQDGDNTLLAVFVFGELLRRREAFALILPTLPWYKKIGFLLDINNYLDRYVRTPEGVAYLPDVEALTRKFKSVVEMTILTGKPQRKVVQATAEPRLVFK